MHYLLIDYYKLLIIYLLQELFIANKQLLFLFHCYSSTFFSIFNEIY